jgi:hypothetical protein
MSVQKTKIQQNFKILKIIFPAFITNWIRILLTAFITPIRFSYKSGHFKSSFKQRAVDKDGNPLPWYSYPAIEFLKTKNFKEKTILEFGSGQSTLWWAKNSKLVKSFEQNESWFKSIKKQLPLNVEIVHLTDTSENGMLVEIEDILIKENSKYDVIVIDGLFRKQLCEIAIRYLTATGVIITDNSEGYGFKEAFDNTGFKRVDFHGYSPGVVLKQSTSIFFNSNCFIFENDSNIEIDY